MVKNDQNGPKLSKWSKMVQDGSKWSKMDKMVNNSRSKKVQNGKQIKRGKKRSKKCQKK